MAVQVRLDINLEPFNLKGVSMVEGNSVLLQDAGRAIVLAPLTLMAKVAASQKWVPFTDEAAVDGSAIPAGIYIGPEIAIADIVAGDVEDLQIIIGGAYTFDTEQLVIENAKTLNTVITVGTTSLRTVKDYLNDKGAFPESTVSITGFEN